MHDVFMQRKWNERLKCSTLNQEIMPYEPAHAKESHTRLEKLPHGCRLFYNNCSIKDLLMSRFLLHEKCSENLYTRPQGFATSSSQDKFQN